MHFAIGIEHNSGRTQKHSYTTDKAKKAGVETKAIKVNAKSGA